MRLILLGIFFAISAHPQNGGSSSRSGSTPLSDDSGKPIEVRGQSRNLNMLLKLQSEREAIDFIKLRKNYRKEIKSQSF